MPSPSSLTTVILTKNSTLELEPLLQVASKYSDQILLLDDFSEDDIHGLAKKWKAQVVQHTLNGDFAAHRNSIYPSVTSEWVLFLDADELPGEDFWIELTQGITTNIFEAFYLIRRNRFLGKELKYGEAGEKKLLRVAKTAVGRNRWQRAVHETWNVNSSKVGVLQSVVLHRQPVSVSEFIAKLNSYSILEQSVRPGLSAAKCCLQLALFPPGKFLWNVLAQQAWRDGLAGLALAWLMSYYSAIVRIQQYEKTL